jgi:PAS domain S-box-containing protein
MRMDQADVIGRVVQDLHPEFIGTNFEADCRRALDGQGPFSWEDYYPPRGRWYKVHVFPNRDGIVIHSAETTDVRHQEQAIAKSLLPQASEADMRKAFDLMPDPVFILDKQLRFTYVNHSALQLNGRRAEEVLGKTPEELRPHIKATGLYKGVLRAIETGADDSFEHYFEPVRRWFRVGLFSVDGQIVVVFVDITALKDREKTIDILTSSLEAALDKGWDRRTARHNNGQQSERDSD